MIESPWWCTATCPFTKALRPQLQDHLTPSEDTAATLKNPLIWISMSPVSQTIKHMQSNKQQLQANCRRPFKEKTIYVQYIYKYTSRK